MERNEILQIIEQFWAESPENHLTEQDALRPDLIDMKIYDAPLIGFGSAADPLFVAYKDPKINGPWAMTPEEWMPGAKTVISMFFPFTEAVRKSNRGQKDGPSDEWLHGRIEGQTVMCALIERLKDWFAERGIAACTPMTDPRFKSVRGGENFREYDCVTERTFGSNWSERHAAYVCGLGTFSLSKGMITERGIAGRFTSIIISEEFEADVRPYTEVYEYCTMCGACARRCPVGAIDLKTGKDHVRCKEWALQMAKLHAPRFGCGLCQTGVPCESCRPKKRK